jgi:hypothetical protein
VWGESRWIANTSAFTRTGVTAVLTHEFDETVISGTKAIATPTDYFRYDITVTDVDHPPADPLHASGEEYAFLMESQWIAPLPEVQETSAGAAPDELTVYCCDMFPFQKNIHDPTTWLPREDVPDYVRTELVPAMIEAFRVQTDDWGFPWHDAWTGHRAGEDAERLSVALSNGRAWFHGRAPLRGHSRISIQVLYYDPPLSTITYTGADQRYSDAIKSSFGMDFVDVILDPTADGQPVTLEFHAAPGADAGFDVQIWPLMDSEVGTRPRRVGAAAISSGVPMRTNPDGRPIYTIPAIDTAATNRLGLIITRTDARESSDPVGEYTIVLHPGTSR